MVSSLWLLQTVLLRTLLCLLGSSDKTVSEIYMPRGGNAGPTLQIRNLRLSELKETVQDHTTSK